MSDCSRGASGVQFFGMMFLIFMTLKLCSIITWSWWWVSAPLWGPALFVLSLFFAILIIWGTVGLISVVGGWALERIKEKRE